MEWHRCAIGTVAAPFKMEISLMDSENQQPRMSKRSLYGAVTIVVFLLVLIAGFVVRYEEARTDVPPAPTAAKSSAEVIEPTPEQLRQVRVEAVRDREIELDLETTGKVGFNEDRMTPVFAPYSGRVLEVLANKGDVVKAGQPLLVIESPDLVATVHGLAEARADAEKAKIGLDIAETAA